MNISRSFLLIGTLYLLVGMILGMHMGGSGDHTLAPVHAHINLLGFTLMAVFAGVYKLFPDMAQASMARLHFWLHQAGSVILVTGLFLMMSHFIAEATIGPVLLISEIILVLGTVIFCWNVYKNAN